MRIVDRTEYDFTYLSFGAGWQSTALYVLSTLGERGVPDADIAVFADTGDEPAWVYEQLEAVDRWGMENGGPPIYTVSKGHSLSESMITRQQEGKRFVSVPLYTIGPDGSSEGMLKRQCTKEFKIEPIEAFVRAYLGYRPRERMPKSFRARALIGISIDEAIRMKPNRTKWITNAWPLVDAAIARHECKGIVTAAGLPAPRKSACVFCPYRRDMEWAELKREAPEEFAKAVAFDHAIRDMTMRGRDHPAYVHRSGLPLDEVEFEKGDPDQVDMFNEECEGMCGV